MRSDKIGSDDADDEERRDEHGVGVAEDARRATLKLMALLRLAALRTCRGATLREPSRKASTAAARGFSTAR